MSRRVQNCLFIFFTRIALLLCGAVLFFLLSIIVWNGASAINIDFLLSPSSRFGSEGGIAYQILGSLLMVLVAGLICLPIAMGTAIYKSEFMADSGLQKIFTLLIYGLNGVPSIIFGIFGLLFFINILQTGISWFVGSLVLAMMMLPTVVLSTFQAINNVPLIYRESAYSLGMNKWQVIVKVLMPAGFNGALTGLLLGLARAVGETAPIMFIASAFSGVNFPNTIFEPVATLPTHILALTQQALNPQALENAWGASLVLIWIVILFSASGLFLRSRLRKTNWQ